MRAHKSLTVRLSFTIFLTALICALTAGAFTTYIFISSLKKNYDTRLYESTRDLVLNKLVYLTAQNEFSEMPRAVDKAALILTDPVIRVFDSKGVLLFTLNSKERPIDLPREETSWPKEHVFNGVTYDYMTMHYKLKTGESRIVRVHQPLPPLSDILLSTVKIYVFAFFFFLVVSTVISRRFSKSLLAPVGQVADHLTALSRLEPTRWSTIPEQDDGQFLGRIVSAGNHLIARVQESFLSTHYMTRYISHEVRTPLTMMLGEIETADLSRLSRSEIERIFSRFRGDILEIENIIQTILGLARRGRSESPYKPENVFIREVLSAEIKKIERAFHVLVQVGIEKDYEVFIDPDLFSILVDNLLRNALRHGRGEIAVRVAEPSPKGSIIVFVEDSGPGLDLDFLEVANSSFLHRDLGIGLTLCKEVCRITGWRLKFSNRQPHGCSASIEIPSFTEIFQGKPSVFSWQLDAVIRHKTDSI